MTGTTPQKFVRLVANLALNPQHVGRYVNHNIRKTGSPMDLEIPWFSYSAIDYLETRLTPDMRVFEFGSGGSTLFFAKRTRSVRSVENNSEWYKKVTDRLKEKSIRNVEVKLHPFDVENPADFESSDYLKAMGEERYDIIVIDGAEEWKQTRPICFKHAENRLNPGGMIIVDDSWRYSAELHKKNKAREHRVFRSVGPCRPGVTSTDVFFY